MKTNRFSTKLQSGKIVLSALPSVGNGTIKVSATPFPLKDTIFYQVGPDGDYRQETH